MYHKRGGTESARETQERKKRRTRGRFIHLISEEIGPKTQHQLHPYQKRWPIAEQIAG